MTSIFSNKFNELLIKWVNTSSGAHPASYQMDNGVLSPGEKWPRHEADNSAPSSAEIRNMWNYTSTPLHIFTTLYLVKHSYLFPYEASST